MRKKIDKIFWYEGGLLDSQYKRLLSVFKKEVLKKIDELKLTKVGQRAVGAGIGLVQGRYASEAYNQALSEVKEIIEEL